MQEPTASRLLTIHNLHWCLDLMRRARDAIRAGRFEALRAEIGAVWSRLTVGRRIERPGAVLPRSAGLD